MRFIALAIAQVLLNPWGGVATPQESWLPPAVEDATVQQLADRMGEIGLGQTDRQRLNQGAQQAVDGLRARLESWGEKGVLDRAPQFSKLSVPASGQPHLDAMLRYQICNLVMMRQHLDPASQGATNARVTAVMGLSAFTLAIVYLRHPFVTRGGSAEKIEAFLTDAALQPLFDSIQSQPALREHAEAQCGPVLAALLE